MCYYCTVCDTIISSVFQLHHLCYYYITCVTIASPVLLLHQLCYYCITCVTIDYCCDETEVLKAMNSSHCRSCANC